MRFAISIVTRFPNLHKMDNLVIDYKLQNVLYCTSNQELLPILSSTNGRSQKFSISIEDFDKFLAIIKTRETRNAAMIEEDLVKSNAEMSQREIVGLKKKLELVQKDTEMLMSFMKNGFTEMNDNFSKIIEHIKA